MKQTDESIVQVPVSSLRSFPNHPFRITDDESMQQLADSIRLLGVLNPVIIRYMDGITWQLRVSEENYSKIKPDVATSGCGAGADNSRQCHEEYSHMDKMITRKEAAKILGISIAALDQARTTGQISYVQYVENGCVYFTETALQEYVARCTHRAKPLENNATYRKPRK